MASRTRRSRAAMVVTVPVVLAVSGLWAVAAARGAGDPVVVTATAEGSTASPAATPEEFGPDGWSWSTNPTGTDRPASAAIRGRRRAT